MNTTIQQPHRMGWDHLGASRRHRRHGPAGHRTRSDRGQSRATAGA